MPIKLHHEMNIAKRTRLMCTTYITIKILASCIHNAKYIVLETNLRYMRHVDLHIMVYLDYTTNVSW